MSKKFYGDAGQYKRIFEANRDQLTDPDRIKPGQHLKILPDQACWTSREVQLNVKNRW